MNALSENVAALCDAVWQTLDLPLAWMGDSPVDPSETTFEGHVQISGDWRGVVVVQCSEAFARHAAERMFGLGLVSKSEALDTIGELTNIIGGNLKAVLSEEGCSLSLPVVIEGNDFAVHMKHTRVIGRDSFRSDDAVVVVTIMEAID